MLSRELHGVVAKWAAGGFDGGQGQRHRVKIADSATARLLLAPRGGRCTSAVPMGCPLATQPLQIELPGRQLLATLRRGLFLRSGGGWSLDARRPACPTEMPTGHRPRLASPCFAPFGRHVQRPVCSGTSCAQSNPNFSPPLPPELSGFFLIVCSCPRLLTTSVIRRADLQVILTCPIFSLSLGHKSSCRSRPS